MTRKQSVHSFRNSFAKGIGLGVIISMLCTIIGTAVGAWLVYSEKVGEGSAPYIAVSTLFLSGILGAVIAVATTEGKRMVVCLISGLAYFLSLLGMTALFFEGQYSGVGESGLVILGGALAVALLGLRNPKKNKKRGVK